jgi:LacI family transcriptional regulator
MNLKELAAHLGLSKATVSRALAGHTDISEQTRRRVREAATAADYRPAAAALRLRSGKSGAIGVVLPSDPTSFEHPFNTELISGMAEQTAEAGLDLVISVPPPRGDEIMAIKRLVEGRRVDGIVLTRIRHDDERVDYLCDRGFPFVSFGRSRRADQHPWVDVDGNGAMLNAARRLIFQGHRHIAYISAPMIYLFAHHRRSGYLSALAEARIPFDPALELVVDLFGEMAAEPIANLLTRSPQITALLCANDSMALAALKAIRQCGKNPRVDIAVIGYGDLPYSTMADPPLTTTKICTRAAGQRLIELLLQHLRGTAVATLQEFRPATLVLRQSDGPPPQQEQQRREAVALLAGMGS